VGAPVHVPGRDPVHVNVPVPLPEAGLGLGLGLGLVHGKATP
jgi:hypothetical protein